MIRPPQRMKKSTRCNQKGSSRRCYLSIIVDRKITYMTARGLSRKGSLELSDIKLLIYRKCLFPHYSFHLTILSHRLFSLDVPLIVKDTENFAIFFLR